MMLDDKKELERVRDLLERNGFRYISVGYVEEGESKTAPLKTKLPPKTYSNGAGTFITDSEGITWASPKDVYIYPEDLGLVGYEYFSWQSLLDPHAVK